MKNYDVIIIGAGAAGLSAARALCLNGKKVLVLEARSRVGGRIHSIDDPAFPHPVEAGAEFIHGKLPVTLDLLTRAAIKRELVGGSIFKVKGGFVQKTEEFIEGWEELMEKLEDVKVDIPISEFLTEYFPGEKYNDLRKTVTNFVEGYDAADVHKASTLALREEWENQDEEQERIPAGYSSLLAFLLDECKMLGCELLPSREVQLVSWSTGYVEIKTATESFYGHKALVTIPLSLWQAKKGTKGYISYMPALAEKEAAAKEMGYGSVIKILFLFDSMFWEEAITNKMNDAGFIFSDAEIPTWWTQHPRTAPLLTGWLGGPKSNSSELQNHSLIIEKGIKSLAYIFGATTTYISEKLKAHKVFNWAQEPYSLGAYSYATIGSKNAKEILSTPLENTLFFAGEALYKGKEAGTVEAALASGIEVANRILGDRH